MSLVDQADGAPPTPTLKFEEDAQINLNQLRHAAILAPSDALAIEISVRGTALLRLAAQHFAILNACKSPFLRLPREILEHILTDVVAGEDVQKWIKLGQICSALRGILLGLHLVWADAVCMWPGGRHRDKLLERAGSSTPLRFYLPEIDDTSGASQFGIDHLDRARVIDASNALFIERFVKNEDSSCLPYLEKINFTYLGTGPEAKLERPSRQTPQLKRVRLCDVFWNFCPSTITNLTLTSIYSTRACPPSHFLDMIRQSHCLHDLCIENCLPYIPDALLSGGAASLPSLRVLDVTDSREYALQFWRSISVSSDVKAVFSLSCGAQTSPPHPDYRGPPCFQDSALFKRHFQRRQIVALKVIDVGTSGVGLAISSVPQVEDVGPATPSAYEQTLVLRYSRCFRNNYSSPALCDRLKDASHRMCTELGLFGVVCLSLEARLGSGNHDHWIDMLGRFSNVECLDLVSLSSPFCAALSSFSTPTSTATSNSIDTLSFPPPLPNLRILTVKSAQLLAKDDEQSTWASTTGFLDMMRSRSDRGCPVGMLRLPNLQVGTDPYFARYARYPFVEELGSQFPDCRVELE